MDCLHKFSKFVKYWQCQVTNFKFVTSLKKILLFSVFILNVSKTIYWIKLDVKLFAGPVDRRGQLRIN